MATKNNSKKKKNNPLAAAASRKLAGIAGPAQRFDPEQVAHMMMHAEERGEAERVGFDDGSWGWRVMGPNGPQILKPTPEMLAALERFEREGHPAHDHEHDHESEG